MFLTRLLLTAYNLVTLLHPHSHTRGLPDKGDVRQHGNLRIIIIYIVVP
jgi:hypothetical protein